MFGKKKPAKVVEEAPAVSVTTTEVVDEPTIVEQIKKVEEKVDQIIEKIELQDMTVEQLKEYAKENGVKLSRGMVKAEIIKKISKRERTA
jgi:FtsZ-binding cell division protein ZapB